MRLPAGSAKVKGGIHPHGLTIIPDGTIVDAQIVKCEIRDIPDSVRREYGIQQSHSVSIQFAVMRGEYANRILYLTLYPETYPNGEPWPQSQFYNWIKGLLGEDVIKNGYIFDTDDFTGLPACLRVGVKVDRNGNDKNYIALAPSTSALGSAIFDFKASIEDF